MPRPSVSVILDNQMSAGIKTDPNTLFQQAISRFQEGNIAEAIDICRLLQKQDPKNPHVLHMHGIAETQEETIPKAWTCLRSQ